MKKIEHKPWVNISRSGFTVIKTLWFMYYSWEDWERNKKKRNYSVLSIIKVLESTHYLHRKGYTDITTC